MQINHISLALILPLAIACNSQKATDFLKDWTVESESPEYTLSVNEAGECIISAPKGLTFWYNTKLTGDVLISYEATVFTDQPNDRLSDLNCFWMASDPRAGSVFASMEERGGVFANCATMQLYYVGYGGNWNSTTRFRRYNGEPDPPIIAEYSDEAHLLVPDHWYSIELRCKGGRVSYTIDGDTIFEYDDPDPLTEGWFGFRTTLSRTGIRNFSYKQL